MDKNNLQSNLTPEERKRIKATAIAQCRRLRIKNGLKSLLKNPIKAVIALLYVAGVAVLWFLREQLLERIYSGNNTLLSQIWHMIFTWGIPILATVFFLAMMELFGTAIYYANKFLSACISAGIYTSVKKSPWLLDRYKDKNEPIYTVWEIYLNGNTKQDFESKKDNLNSELGIKIESFYLKDTETLLIYAVQNKAKKRKSNRNDMNY